MSETLTNLATQWLEAKARETLATKDRRKIEDDIKALVRLNENIEGTETFEADCYVIKAVPRIDRNVNSEKLQELAAEAGLTDHLTSLFRWKPELNMGVWKNTDASITSALAPAITAKPGRASFTVVIKGETK